MHTSYNSSMVYCDTCTIIPLHLESLSVAFVIPLFDKKRQMKLWLDKLANHARTQKGISRQMLFQSCLPQKGQSRTTPSLSLPLKRSSESRDDSTPPQVLQVSRREILPSNSFCKCSGFPLRIPTNLWKLSSLSASFFLKQGIGISAFPLDVLKGWG